jgi:hypothetical protein
MLDKSLQKNILFTIAYFAAFDYALSTFELWRNLFVRGENRRSVSYKEVLSVLEQQPLADKLVRKMGFVTLKKEEYLINERISRQKFSLASIRRIKFWIKILAHLPYMRGIFLTGTLSMKNARKKSDWDIFVVLAKNKIWVGRFFLVMALQLLGKRRHKDKIEKRFCLNHYVTDSGLILEEHNEFCSNFVSFSIPVFGEELHRKYLSLNEQWIKHQKPNFGKEEVLNQTSSVEVSLLKEKLFFEAALEKFGLGKLLNDLAKKYMIRKIQNNPATYFKDADIRYTDVALVFLPKPHRIEMLEKTSQKLTNCV